MANQIDGGTQKQGAVSGIDQELRTQKDKLHRDEPSRDGRLDKDKERERLEPGQNAEGTGGAGAGPDTPSDGNSNT